MVIIIIIIVVNGFFICVMFASPLYIHILVQVLQQN